MTLNTTNGAFASWDIKEGEEKRDIEKSLTKPLNPQGNKVKKK